MWGSVDHINGRYVAGWLVSAVSVAAMLDMRTFVF